jgi:hypothetical protein
MNLISGEPTLNIHSQEEAYDVRTWHLSAATTPYLLSLTTIQPPSAGLLPISVIFMSHCDPNQSGRACTTFSMHDLQQTLRISILLVMEQLHRKVWP